MLSVKETKDKDEIKKILCHPEIYERIKDDNCPECQNFNPPDWAVYIGGYLGNDIIGLMIYHKENGELKCHFQVLPEHRKHALQLARMAFDFGEAKNASIYAEIPECYPEVVFFAKRLGFRKSGVIKRGHKTNGQLYDVIRLRLHRGIH